jgi:hypothetical protein
VLDLAGLLGGLFVCPRRTVRAFRRGRRQQNLYPYAPQELLRLDYAQAKELTEAAPGGALARLPASAHLALLVLAAFPVAVDMSVLWWVFTPAWLLTRRRPSAGRTADRRGRGRGR